MTKSVHDVVPDKKINILVSKVSARDRLIPKGMVIGYVARYSLALISQDGPGAQEICGVLNIFPPPVPTVTRTIVCNKTRPMPGRVDANNERRNARKPLKGPENGAPQTGKIPSTC